MRRFLGEADPVFQEPIPAGWAQVPERGWSPFALRVMSYLSIIGFVGGCLAPIAFGVDPIQAVGVLYKKYGFLKVLAVFLIGEVLLTILHELMHMAVHPDKGLSNKTVVGIHPMMAFTMYFGEMTSKRYIAMLLTPFLGIWVVLGFAWLLAPEFRPLFYAWGLLHIGSCLGDFALAVKIARHSKSYSAFMNQGARLVGRPR